MVGLACNERSTGYKLGPEKRFKLGGVPMLAAIN